MATGPFVEACDLLEGPTLREARVAIPSEQLDLDRLGAVDDPPPGHSQYLRFVPKPMNAVELTRWRNRSGAPKFDAPGRLARVGLAARLVDAGLVTSLLLRGRVPGGTTAAASVKYEAIRAKDPQTYYHARVLRDGPWIVLHYLFFYAMNDWRSTFDGANDHESDWEQCFVILEALPDGDVSPAWFCAAAHDEKGDDLRRRWDDPRLTKTGDHPMVFPGAGSHATYLEQGEYIMALPFPGEQNLHGPLDLLRGFWRDTLAQPDPGDLSGKVRKAFSVPVRRLRPRRRLPRRAGRRQRVGADPDRRRRPLGGRLPRPVGPRHGRPVRRRTGAGRTRSTPGPDRSARPGTTRSGSPGWARWRRRRNARPCWKAASRSCGRSAPPPPPRPPGSPRPCPPSSRRSRPCAGPPGWSATRPPAWPSWPRARPGWAPCASRRVELDGAIAASERRVADVEAGDPRGPARPPASRLRAGTAARRGPPGVRRDLGGAERRACSSSPSRSSSGSASCRRSPRSSSCWRSTSPSRRSSAVVSRASSCASASPWRSSRP